MFASSGEAPSVPRIIGSEVPLQWIADALGDLPFTIPPAR